ncbi:MAG: BMP family ABC transporter substrate-binding protein [Oscillospiraceae bacterium]|nr:BMP family ABC transporter substrate-binding protein [Oscillospiraceae bacterium]
MKKFLALMLALVMVLSLAACGGNTNTETTEPETEGGEEVVETAAMKVAMITDYGDITDQSFNQTTYEAAKAWSEANGVEFNYFKPASDSDDDRVAMIEKAIDEGFNVIVMPGYAFAAAIAKTAPEYSDVTFVALDVSEYDLTTAGLATLPANLYSAVYQEELAGYMAGYAAVKLGYTKLGFLGGMAVPAVQRYGYGFVQGADAAAAADGKTDVAIKYAYGNQFYGDADITAAMDTWYADGVEVVFACGGGIFTSAGEAAAKVEGAKVIGVDVDQAATIDGLYGEGMTVTSAMKGLAATVNTLLTQVKDGSFQGGRVENLGLVSADVEANYVQLPVASTQWNDTFAQADYEALVASLFAGDITVDNDITKAAGDFATVVAVDDLGNIK